MTRGQVSLWQEVPLGEILTFVDEQVPFDDMAEYITITVKRRHGGLEAREKLFGHEIKTKKQFRLHRGAFIISRVQCWHAAFAIVPDDVPINMIASQNYDQFEISPSVDQRYFWWFSYSPAFLKTVRSSASGVVIEKMVFNRDAWLQKTIPLPPLDEQRRIVARIEALSARVSEAQSLRERALEETEAILPGTYAAVYDEAVKIAGGTERLEDVCYMITDGTHVTPTYVSEGVPFLSVKDITSGTIRFDDAKFITPEEHTVLSKRYKPERGDVLLTKVGTTGFAKAIDVDREFSIFVSLALLKIDRTRLEPKFVEYMLNSTRLREQSATGTRGVGNKNLVLKFIKEFPIPVPPVSKQRQIVAHLDAIQAKVDELRRLQAETRETLSALVPSILDRAFKGAL